jgi:hypothetical protein
MPCASNWNPFAMDDTLQDLENELKRLRPRGPSAELLTRLDSDLGAPVRPRRYVSATSLRSWKWAGWSLAGATAVAALLLALRPTASVAPTPTRATPASTVAQAASRPTPGRYTPVRASSVLYDMKEDGFTRLSDNSEARQVRYRYVDTYTWKNPSTNASLRWSVPRDEVRVVRASLD